MSGDCIHHAHLCPDCDGLVATRLDRVGDVHGFELVVDTITFGGPHATAVLYVGPPVEPCNREEAGL